MRCARETLRRWLRIYQAAARLHDNPLYAMERRRKRRGHLTRRGALLLFAAPCFATSLLLLLLPPASAPESLRTWAAVLFAAFLGLAPFLAALPAAAETWGDRRSGLWTELRLTSLTPDEVLAGRVAPILGRTFPLAAAASGMACLTGLLLGAVSPAGPPAGGASTAVLAGLALLPLSGALLLLASVGGIRAGLERGDRAHAFVSASRCALAAGVFVGAFPVGVMLILSEPRPPSALALSTGILLFACFTAALAWGLWESCVTHLRRAESREA